MISVSNGNFDNFIEVIFLKNINLISFYSLNVLAVLRRHSSYVIYFGRKLSINNVNFHFSSMVYLLRD